MKSQEGFSLVELMAATVILGLLIAVVLAPLSNLFRQTAASSRTLQVSTQAQQVLESIKGEWRSVPTPSPSDYYTGGVFDQTAFETAKASSDAVRDTTRSNYDRSCYPNATVPANATVVIRGVNRNGAVTGGNLGCVAQVPAITQIPVMKRITVTIRNDEQQTILSVDVPRPPANDPVNNL